jgi:ribosomal protein S18 acetylase RimI-like enzyme
VQIRNATPDDADAVLALWKVSDATPSVTDSADALRRIATRAEVAFLVAVADGAVVGSIIAAFDGWRGNVYRLATHPHHRRRGIARSLLACAEEALRAWGARRITALVENAHPDAVGFWRSTGFVDDKRISRFVRTLTALLVLAGTLVVSGAGCRSAARDPRYPRRPPGCALEVYEGTPKFPGGWDDIGLAQVDCYLDESEITCLGRLRTEACRMGGDIIYNVPKKALRPVERGMIYRVQVAHTHAIPKKDETPISADAGGGTVVPLPIAADSAAPAAPSPSPPASPPPPAPGAAADAGHP